MKTVRRPPYPKWNPGYFPCSSLTPPSAFLTPSIGVLRWIRDYTVPMPRDSRIAGMDSEEVAIPRYGRPRGDASEFGAVTVSSNPPPDAEDRLRRLFTLLIKHATRTRSLSEDSFLETKTATQ